MPIRTSKTRINRKNTSSHIHIQIKFLTTHSTRKKICHIGANQIFHTSPYMEIALRVRHNRVGT